MTGGNDAPANRLNTATNRPVLPRIARPRARTAAATAAEGSSPRRRSPSQWVRKWMLLSMAIPKASAATITVTEFNGRPA